MQHSQHIVAYSQESLVDQYLLDDLVCPVVQKPQCCPFLPYCLGQEVLGGHLFLWALRRAAQRCGEAYNTIRDISDIPQ